MKNLSFYAGKHPMFLLRGCPNKTPTGRSSAPRNQIYRHALNLIKRLSVSPRLPTVNILPVPDGLPLPRNMTEIHTKAYVRKAFCCVISAYFYSHCQQLILVLESEFQRLGGISPESCLALTGASHFLTLSCVTLMNLGAIACRTHIPASSSIYSEEIRARRYFISPEATRINN